MLWQPAVLQQQWQRWCQGRPWLTRWHGQRQRQSPAGLPDLLRCPRLPGSPTPLLSL